ncbi:MFS transporter [Nonomuraea sp. NPDC050202]|uniref:MFS transporter n=1 Tax=Nonomuraea sp. NPDC050202 TaxID=3155035 RepID=UPI0033D75C00
MTVHNARKWWALGALNLAVLAVGLPVTMLNVALPTLAGALRASASDLQWFVAAFLLALAAGLLPAGALGDLVGRKRMLVAALTVYGAGSVAAAFAPSPTVFVAAQALLGLAAGFVIPLVLSTLAVLFTAAERPRAVGIWAAANFVAMPLGPIVGGWILSQYWWGWIFLVNLPVVALAVIAAITLLPESRSTERPGLDPLGVMSSSGGLVLLTYGTIRAGQDGWTTTGAILAMAAGLLLLIAFVLWQLRLTRHPLGRPLLDLGLFLSRPFTGGALLQGLAGFVFFGLLFAAPQYFQVVLGTDAMGSGVRLLSLLVAVVAGSVLADRIAARIGARLTLAAGFALLAGSLASGAATTSAASGYGPVAAWMVCAGIAAGLAFATSSATALAAVSAERAGTGSATIQAIQKISAPLSAAILGSALNAGYRNALPSSEADAIRESVFAGLAVAEGKAPLLATIRAAFIQGLDSLLWIAAGAAAAGVILALIVLPRRVIADPGAFTSPTSPQKIPNG